MTLKTKDGRTIQPHEIFKVFGYKEGQEFGTPGKEETRVDPAKVLSWAFAFLLYMKPGDILETSAASFKKLGPDLIQIDSDINLEVIADNMEKRNIMRLPV